MRIGELPNRVAEIVIRNSHPLVRSEIPEDISRPKIPTDAEVIFPWAKMNFMDGTFGDGGQALHNAFVQGYVIPGDAIKITLIPHESSKISPRPVDIYYVYPHQSKSPSARERPRHIVYSTSSVSGFFNISRIGDWEIIEKNAPTYAKNDIQREVERRTAIDSREEEISRLREILNKLQGK